jgi:hypothetical protein
VKSSLDDGRFAFVMQMEDMFISAEGQVLLYSVTDLKRFQSLQLAAP